MYSRILNRSCKYTIARLLLLIRSVTLPLLLGHRRQLMPGAPAADGNTLFVLIYHDTCLKTRIRTYHFLIPYHIHFQREKLQKLTANLGLCPRVAATKARCFSPERIATFSLAPCEFNAHGGPRTPATGQGMFSLLFLF